MNQNANFVKKESLESVLENFPEQEKIVFNSIDSGFTDAHSIADKTGLLITSIRRALTNLRKKNYIELDFDKENNCYKKKKYSYYINGVEKKIPSAVYRIKPVQISLF